MAWAKQWKMAQVSEPLPPWLLLGPVLAAAIMAIQEVNEQMENSFSSLLSM